MPNVVADTADAIVTALAAATLSLEISPARSYAQWQQPFEVAESQGLRVDVVPVSRIDAELETRGSIGYRPRTDVVVRKKFAGSALEAVPGETASRRVKNSEVDPLVQLVLEIHQALKAQRIGEGDEAAWEEEEILATYMPSHLRLKHQFTGVVRVTHAVSQAL